MIPTKILLSHTKTELKLMSVHNLILLKVLTLIPVSKISAKGSIPLIPPKNQALHFLAKFLQINSVFLSSKFKAHPLSRLLLKNTTKKNHLKVDLNFRDCWPNIKRHSVQRMQVHQKNIHFSTKVKKELKCNKICKWLHLTKPFWESVEKHRK